MIYYISAPDKRGFAQYCVRNKINRGRAIFVPRENRQHRNEVLRNIVFDANVVLVGPFTSDELAAGSDGTVPTVVRFA